MWNHCTFTIDIAFIHWYVFCQRCRAILLGMVFQASFSAFQLTCGEQILLGIPPFFLGERNFFGFQKLLQTVFTFGWHFTADYFLELKGFCCHSCWSGCPHVYARCTFRHIWGWHKGHSQSQVFSLMKYIREDLHGELGTCLSTLANQAEGSCLVGIFPAVETLRAADLGFTPRCFMWIRGWTVPTNFHKQVNGIILNVYMHIYQLIYQK